jgi:DNA-directed RNA polymerase specialized sigma24 family protein
MTTSDDPAKCPRAATSETEIRWDEAVVFLRRRLERDLRAGGRAQIDDLVQESLVRLLRAVRREPIENVEALMTEIARRVAIDCVRREVRWNALVEPAGAALDRIADPSPDALLGDPLERLQFVVLEFFTARETRCRELAVAYFAEQDWKRVAARAGRSHEAVRKQWSRCLDMLRASAREEPGPLMECLRHD